MTAPSDEHAGAVFAALADPTRRRVLQALAEQPGVTASALAAELPVSRQAIVKHLTALREAGLAERERSGREAHYRLRPAPLTEAVAWMATTGAQWDDRLARLDRRLSAESSARR
jgi:DNA-binding transcriptional ArsR family regulator